MTRNSSTGEQIQKPVDKVVKITVAKALKDTDCQGDPARRPAP
jgi:DNA-binding protein HU-beta